MRHTILAANITVGSIIVLKAEQAVAAKQLHRRYNSFSGLSEPPAFAHSWLAEAEEDLGDSLKTSMRAFPLAGAVLGFLAGLALLISDYLHLPAIVSSLIAVGMLAAMTGALHEDGLGDTADGFLVPLRRIVVSRS